MSTRLVECVPNFSEGRDRKKIDQIVAAAAEVEGISVLDVDPGADTNRTVVTLLGPPESIGEAAFRAIRRAAELIDMSVHHGAHPRHGATDVCPFVPVAGVTMDDCVAIAQAVGKRVGEELGIPVWLYDRAAARPERRSLAKVRAGEYEALADKLARPEWAPDFGPATFLPKTGVVTVGAREFLIAYNVNLNTRSKELADDIAFEIREAGRAVRRGQQSALYNSGKLLKYQPSEGRFPCGECETLARGLAELEAHCAQAHGTDLRAELDFFGRDAEAAFADPSTLEGVNVMKRGMFTECRAVGWVIDEYDRAQISINLTDFHVTPAHVVLEACRTLAAERGVIVTGSEVVGMIPHEALAESGEYYLSRTGTTRGVPARDVLQTAVQSMGLSDVGSFELEKQVLGLPPGPGPLASRDVAAFTDEVSRPSPAPGGGSIAALAGSLGAALAAMVANLSHAKKGYEERRDELEQVARAGQGVRQRLVAAIDEDAQAFNDVIAAMRMAKGTDAEREAREAAIQAGYRHATDVPLSTAELCLEALRMCRLVAEKGNPASITDAGVGALMARAGVLGGIDNVRINLPSITEAAWVGERTARLAALRDEADALEREVRGLVDAALRPPA
ncbi:MAG: glutamate formimidoyltransferase [Planctomycetota bacterium]|jgi:glutamate formiminotransferase/formiminotetrahydrofolate cyclodeaminase